MFIVLSKVKIEGTANKLCRSEKCYLQIADVVIGTVTHNDGVTCRVRFGRARLCSVKKLLLESEGMERLLAKVVGPGGIEIPKVELRRE